ncbi:hypothetical protein SAMN04515620_12041 [Collimonas sp. OK607]|nr:hypothetical protein SAMN04515620_12041 [Collimonas sp. OK607]
MTKFVENPDMRGVDDRVKDNILLSTVGGIGNGNCQCVVYCAPLAMLNYPALGQVKLPQAGHDRL